MRLDMVRSQSELKLLNKACAAIIRNPLTSKKWRGSVNVSYICPPPPPHYNASAALTHPVELPREFMGNAWKSLILGVQLHFPLPFFGSYIKGWELNNRL